MKNEVFTTTVLEAFRRSLDILSKKEKEYSDGKDRLIQFKKTAVMESRQPTETLFSMADKHITSIADMVKDPMNYTLKQWRAKLDDLRNYTFLLDALITEMKEEQE